MFRSRKQKEKVERLAYDPARQKPIIRASICNGEQVGGLKDLQTGHFTDVMFIRDADDLRTFQDMVGTTNIPKEY